MRESNIELLRILSMMAVVVVHLDGGCLGLPDLHGDVGRMGVREFWRLGVESFAFIGVNCFTLISGFFGIRLRWRGVASFLFECVFYSVGIYGLAAMIRPDIFSWQELAESAMVLTHTDLWYVPAYFILMLVSPWLNLGFENMTRRRGLVLTLFFTAFTFWAGWWWGATFNASGYTAWQLVMIYCIGRVMASYRDDLARIGSRLSRGHPTLLWLAIYIAGCLATIAGGIYDFRRAYSYNQPMVVVASVSFFMIFVGLKVRSRRVGRMVNYAARSAFAVYLLHKSPYIWGSWLKPAVVKMWHSTSLMEFTLIVIALTAGIYLCAMLIDILRRRLYHALTRLRG